MKLPSGIVLNFTLEQGAVYYFQDKQIHSSKYHYFVLLNKNPIKDKKLHFVICTSNIKLHTKRCKNNPETLITLTPNDYKELTKEKTAINCNRLKKETKITLADKIDRNVFSVKKKIPKKILYKIINGVNLSNQVTQAIKDLL